MIKGGEDGWMKGRLDGWIRMNENGWKDKGDESTLRVGVYCSSFTSCPVFTSMVLPNSSKIKGVGLIGDGGGMKRRGRKGEVDEEL